MTIKKNSFITLAFVILLTPFLSISGIRNTMATSTYQAWQIASVISLFLFVCIVASQIKVNWAVGLFGLYHLIVLLSTFWNHGFSSGILAVTIASLLLFMLLQSSYYDQIVRAICVIVVLSALINFPVMLLRRNDSGSLFFIGGKNALGMFLIPGVFLLIINALNGTGSIDKKTIAAIALCLVSVFIGSSGTGMVVAALAIGLMVTAITVKPPKRTYLITIIVFYLLFLLFSEDFFVTKYWVSFTAFLDKDSTLTSRTAIWNTAKEIIRQKWLFGSGRGTEISYINTWGIQRSIYEAHNFILEILMEGGIAAFFIYSTLFFKSIKHLDMNNPKNCVIFIALCVLLINGLTESTVNNFFVTIALGIACRFAAENRGKYTLNERKI